MFAIGLWNFDITRFVGETSSPGISSQLKNKGIIGPEKVVGSHSTTCGRLLFLCRPKFRTDHSDTDILYSL